MNVLLLSIDSLRWDVLGAYGAPFDIDVRTPNLDRFAERAATFETHYAGSLPCMPARREWLTGTQEFLWRPWGPIEPFDETLPRLARENGVVSKLITDHFHYIQHGSHGYYEDFNGFEFVRGHEFDAYRTAPRRPDERLLAQTHGDDGPVDSLRFLERPQYARNVADKDERDESVFFGPQVLGRTAQWLRDNQEWDEWFCYVDSFDVHEPFHLPEPYASMYTDEDPRDPDLPVWPHYGRVDEGQSALTDRQLAFVRSQFAGNVTMVDEWFGRVVDVLDEADLWAETTVIVTSDHGFMLGDHGWMGKNLPPIYDVIGHTPLMIWDPTSPRMGEHVGALTAAVDVYATVLDALGIEGSDRRHSRSLAPLLAGATATHRDWALYGYWGSSVNVTDGRFTYHAACDGTDETDCYSTSMMNATSWFTPPTVKDRADAGRYLPYTDAPVWRFSDASFEQLDRSRLFDVQTDPFQERDLIEDDPATADRLRRLLVDALDALEAPANQYERLDLPR